MKCEEAQEFITALVDDELSPQERFSIEGHLKVCARCQFFYEQERALKREIRLAAARVGAPANLRERIFSDPRIFPQRTKPTGEWKNGLWSLRPIFRPAFAGVLLLLLVLPILYLLKPAEESVSLSALETHRKIVEGSISFVRAESHEAVKEQLMQSVSGTFAPMDYDFSMMQLQAVGGMVQDVVGGRKVLVTIYEGKYPSLTCYTFIGTEADVPAGAILFFDPEKKINFYTFSDSEVNGVLHREGKVICILVSKLPVEKLLALARVKAQPS